MPKKSDYIKGFEMLLNHPKTNPFSGNEDAFRAVLSSSEMPVHEALKHLGKKSKVPKKKDSEKSKERLDKLEENIQQ